MLGDWEDLPYQSPTEEKSKPKLKRSPWKEKCCEVMMVVGMKSLSIMRVINTFIGKLNFLLEFISRNRFGSPILGKNT